MNIIVIYIIYITFIGIIFEISAFFTYGRNISEKQLDIFFEKYLDEYSPVDDYLHSRKALPFIAKTYIPILSKWYIYGYGTISRWSKWSRRLDKKLAGYKKNLSNL